MVKKLLALTLALVMCLSILAGCQQDPVDTNPPETTAPSDTTAPADTTAPTEPEPTEYTFPAGATIDVWTSNDYSGTMLEEFQSNATGLNVEYIVAGETEYYAALTREVTPSLIWGWLNPTNNDYGRLGAYVNFFDYEEMMPNFFAKYYENPVVHDWFQLSDDELYMAPAFPNGDVAYGAFIYREDLFAEAGITEMPTDWESFYNVLKTLKAKYPDKYPLALRELNNAALSLFPRFAQMWGANYDTVNFLTLNPEDGTYYEAAITDEFRQMLKHLKQLLDEGLMHPGSMGFSTADWMAVMTSGEAIITHDKAFQISGMEEAGKELNENYSLSWFHNIPMVESDLPYSVEQGVHTSGYMISNRCPDIELAVRYLDWLYTEEGSLAGSWGEQGVSYDLDENGNKYFLDSFPADQRGKMASYSHTPNVDFTATLATYSEKAQKAALETMEQAANGGLVQDPTLSHSADGQAIVTTYIVGYRDTRSAYIQKFLLGQLDINDDADWQAFKDDLVANGFNELKAVYEESYQRMFG